MIPKRLKLEILVLKEMDAKARTIEGHCDLIKTCECDTFRNAECPNIVSISLIESNAIQLIKLLTMSIEDLNQRLAKLEEKR